RLSVLDVALCALFPCIAVPAAVFGALVLHDERPLGWELWSSSVATLVAFVPPILLVVRWRDRALVATGQRAREAEARTTIRDRELEAVSAISTALARTQDPEAAGRLLLRHVLELVGVEFAALALVDEGSTEAVGFLALARAQSAAALEQALERERLVTRIGSRVRSELDVEALLQVAVSEVGAALQVDRCFVRLGVPGEPMPVAAEWLAPGAASIRGRTDALPVSNLALRERRTVAIADIEEAQELDAPDLGGREALRELEARSVLATPILAFDQVIGVLSLHCSRARPWAEADVSVVEAVAREASLALHTARLLEENT